ncbi:hypothetical protein YIM73052_17760 [Thermus antranikianii]
MESRAATTAKPIQIAAALQSMGFPPFRGRRKGPYPFWVGAISPAGRFQAGPIASRTLYGGEAESKVKASEEPIPRGKTYVQPPWPTGYRQTPYRPRWTRYRKPRGGRFTSFR